MANFQISENFGTYGSTAISAILDGNNSTTWQADEKIANGRYVLLTSDELIHINTFRYYTGSSSEIFGSTAYLQISVDGSSYEDVGQFNGQQTQNFTVNRDAQYIRIYCKGSGQYASISELTIDYQAAVKHTITVETGQGITIDRPASEELSGGAYELTITPDAGVTISNATDNGVDILGSLQEHTVSPGGTVTKYPAAYSTSGSVSGTRYRNCIGKGSATTATGNDYASGGSSSTATITYTFDFSEIPDGAVIESVSVKVGGHAENASRSTANLQLYSGNTAKGSQSKFTSTSKQVVTMTPGTWTRDELQEAQLRFTIGYYGGLVNGVDFEVEYKMPGGATKYYTYTIPAVAEDHAIRINMGAPAEDFSGAWVKISGKQVHMDTYQKQNGKYVLVEDPSTLTGRFVFAN